MALLTAILVGVLFAGSVHLLLKRNIFEVLLGTVLLSTAINLFLVSMGGWSHSQKPPILLDKNVDPSVYADPLPHALILTAIVIGFGVTALLVVLIARGHDELGSAEIGELGREEGES